MEGPGKLSFKSGWMRMQSPDEKMHHVFWCPKPFPASFVAQWKAQNLETDAGLCIVFFAATGKDGQSIFADGLPERHGDFRQYTEGALRNYHISYYANAPHNPDRKQTNLRKNPGKHLVAEGPEGIPTDSKKVHTLTLAKQGTRIRLWVDDRKVIDWTDKGRVGGEPHGGGYLGLRQMKWTHFQYRSTWFNASEVDLQPKRACDTVYHPRVFHPALIHWLYSGDATVGKLITRWMDTWVDATARQENGKPAGVTPSAIHWPDGEVGGGVAPWWRPQNYGNDLYAWPSAMSLMTRTMLLTYHMTGDRKYLQPIRSMAAIRLKYLTNPPDDEPDSGSEAWCALDGSGRSGQGMARFLPSTLAKYRILTGDRQFDQLLKADASGYMKMRLGQGRNALVADLRENAEAFRINKPAYTTEMRWTDRVMAYNHRWGNEGNGWNWPTPNTSILYASATGDPGDPQYFPMNAVRWLIEPRAFAALVTQSGRRRFEVELYNFRDEQREVSAELHLLAKGQYILTLSDDLGRELDHHRLVITGPRTVVNLKLPPRTLCRLDVKP